MLLSSTAIILHDIASAIPHPIAIRGVLRKAEGRDAENEVDALAKRVARALRRPASFRVIETSAAEAIMAAVLATRGLQMPKDHRVQLDQVQSLLKDPQLVSFVEEHLVNTSSRPQLKRGEMLKEFQDMVAILDKA